VKKLMLSLAALSLGFFANSVMAVTACAHSPVAVDFWVTVEGDGTIIASNTTPSPDVDHKGAGTYRIRFPDSGTGDGYVDDYSQCAFQVTAIGDPDPDGGVSNINSKKFGTVGFQNAAAPRVQVNMYNYNAANNPEYRNMTLQNGNFSLVLHCIVDECSGGEE